MYLGKDLTEVRSPHRPLVPDEVGPDQGEITFLRGISIKAKADKQHRFQDLYRHLGADFLLHCWRDLNRDAASGVDGVTAAEYAKNLHANIQGLVERLKAKRYRAQRVRRVYIPKENGKERPLGIPALEDKLVQLACAKLLGAIYEPDFLACGYGYRPGRGALDAVRDLPFDLQYGVYGYVVEADVQGFFDHLDHAQLLDMLSLRIDDQAFLGLIRQWLKAGILECDGEVVYPETGSPQGGVVVSPLLANIYLHELDVEMRQAGWVMVRYANDAVVLCRSREKAEAARAFLRAWVSANGLTLHPDKTHVGDCRVEYEGFEFLGYRFEAGKRWVRKKSLMSLRDTIRAKTKRNGGQSIDSVIASLNPTLKGWFAYFKHAHRFTFSSIDGFVRRRLRAMLRRQKHRPGQGRCRNDHQQWPNAFFADLGLFTMSEAHALARQSRCGNN